MSYLVIGFSLLVVGLNVLAIIRLVRHYRDEKKRLVMNLVMLWVVPVLWGLLVILVTRRPGKSRVNSANRYMEAGYKGYTRYF